MKPQTGAFTKPQTAMEPFFFMDLLAFNSTMTVQASDRATLTAMRESFLKAADDITTILDLGQTKEPEGPIQPVYPLED